MLILMSGGSTFDSVVRLIGVVLIFLFVLVATYATTRWIANYQQTSAKNRNIRVIETYRLNSNKYIQIVHVGGKYLAIAVSKDNVSVLTELNEEEIIDFSAVNENKREESFGNILEKFKNRKPKQ